MSSVIFGIFGVIQIYVREEKKSKFVASLWTISTLLSHLFNIVTCTHLKKKISFRPMFTLFIFSGLFSNISIGFSLRRMLYVHLVVSFTFTLSSACYIFYISYCLISISFLCCCMFCASLHLTLTNDSPFKTAQWHQLWEKQLKTNCLAHQKGIQWVWMPVEEESRWIFAYIKIVKSLKKKMQ